MFENILILKPGAIGDLLHLTPVIRQIKKAYPSSKFSILVSSEATKSLFANNPYINKIFIYEKKGLHKRFRDFFKLCREIKEEKFDLILNFQRSNLRLWFLVFYLKLKKVLVYHKNEEKHAVTNHLETLKPLAIDIDFDDIALDLFLDDDSERFADEFFKEKGIQNRAVIALNPGASHKVNRWGVENFSRLATLLEDSLSVKTLIIGGKEDKELAKKIISQTKAEPVDITGEVNLLQLGAILKRCKLLVTGDTGPMHIATAVGTKVIALFGPADPKRTGPVGKGHIVIQAEDVTCVPCRKRVCKNQHYLECMNRIKPEYVFKKIEEALQ